MDSNKLSNEDKKQLENYIMDCLEILKANP